MSLRSSISSSNAATAEFKCKEPFSNAKSRFEMQVQVNANVNAEAYAKANATVNLADANTSQTVNHQPNSNAKC